MNFLNRLPNSAIEVSALGLGTVKFGRDQGVKYPQGFVIPDDMEVRNILAVAREQGIRLLDTAPAYGTSEERLGRLLGNRHDWVICTKVGEEFENGRSRFDFSAAHARFSVERSLKRLNTDCLDIVLIHSDGRDEEILAHEGCVEALRRCQEEGLVRLVGMSAKSDAGGAAAARLLDLVMVTWNLEQQDREAVRAARAHRKGVLVKKGLMSGHLGTGGRDPVLASLEGIFAESGINSVIVGTINPVHLLHNVAMAKRALENVESGP